jgi:iron complex transport system ATP-binding protein
VSIGGRYACRNLDIDIRAGQVWAMLGVTGVGKTTMLHTLAGLRSAAMGQIFLRDQLIGELGRRQVAQKIGVMLQEAETVFPMCVMEAVLEGRHPFLHRFHWESPEDEAIATAALKELSLEHLADRPVQTLSGGERRLVAAATLFTQDPMVMMLDEPNSHLDLHQQLQVLACVARKVRAQDRAAVLILHDVNLACRFCDHALLLHGNGEFALGAIGEVLTERSISRAFHHDVVRLQGPAGPHFVPA